MTTVLKSSIDEKGDKKLKPSEKDVDHPGFDLGGASGETEAGRGLGLGIDAKDDRKGQRLPR